MSLKVLMRRSLPCSRTFVSLLVALLIVPASSQTPAARKDSGDSILHTGANLVLIDVVVTSRDKAVHRIERRRFHVFEDGHEQTIASFDEHTASRTNGAVSQKSTLGTWLPPHTYSNAPAHGSSEATNVLLLDALNTPLASQMDMRRQMLLCLGKIQPGTELAIFTLSSRLRMIVGFTSNASALAEALRSSKAGPRQSTISDTVADQALDTAIGEMADMGTVQVDPQSNLLDPIAAMQQFEADVTAAQTDQRVKMTLEAMQQLARYLSAIPGRKNLIWFSGSFPLTLDPDDSLPSPFEAMGSYSEQVRETSALLSSARVAIYPVDARGLMTSSAFDVSSNPSTNLLTASGSGGRSGSRRTNRSNQPSFAKDNADFIKQTMQEQASMEQIADQTGGNAYINTNGLKDAVAGAVENGSSYYTLGYVPHTLDGQFHKLQIRIDSSAYELKYRDGYYADPPDTASPRNPGQASLIAAATLHGAPPSTQILFEAHVLDANDPQLKSTKVPQGPAGEMTANFRGKMRRVIVDVKADPSGITLQSAPNGGQSAKVEFVLIAYDADGNRVNYLDRGFQLNLKPDQLAQLQTNGIPIRLALDLPLVPVSVRIAVNDLLAGRAGSLEIPWK